MKSEIIDFVLDQSANTADLVYRPWGVRTLKVRVSSGTTTPALRIRPQDIRPEDTDAGIFRAYADDSEAFIVSWGGGHEEGPCLQSEDFLMAFEKCAPLEADTSSTIFFNVNHVGPDVPQTATVTLEAYDAESGEVFATLPVQLQRPATLPADVVRFEKTGEANWHANGRSLPQYDPRWWPRTVEYVSSSDSLPLTIEVQKPKLLVKWDGKVAAAVEDHTDPTILDMDMVQFELFHFDQWHLALRIWFFWLDTNIGGGFFVGRHEVPDAERFDLLIRKRDGMVTLACTDLHWREVWGYLVEGPLEATLGLSRKTKIKLAQEKLGSVWSTWKREEGSDHKRVYNPIRDVERMAETWYGKETLPVGTLRAKGTEAHLPMLHNVEQTEEKPPRMTSSDVRLG